MVNIASSNILEWHEWQTSQSPNKQRRIDVLHRFKDIINASDWIDR